MGPPPAGTRDEFETHRVAHHEAGHHVAAFLLGRELGAVSVRPTLRWGGVSCSFRQMPADTSEWLDTGEFFEVPHGLWPAHIPIHWEGEILGAWAGPLSERFAPRLPVPMTAAARFLPPDALDRAHELAGLAAEDRASLDRGNDPNSEEVISDAERALLAAEWLDPHNPHRTLEYYYARAASWVATEHFTRLRTPLAQALIEHTDIGATDALRILEESGGTPIVTAHPRTRNHFGVVQKDNVGPVG